VPVRARTSAPAPCAAGAMPAALPEQAAARRLSSRNEKQRGKHQWYYDTGSRDRIAIASLEILSSAARVEWSEVQERRRLARPLTAEVGLSAQRGNDSVLLKTELSLRKPTFSAI